MILLEALEAVSTPLPFHLPPSETEGASLLCVLKRHWGADVTQVNRPCDYTLFPFGLQAGHLIAFALWSPQPFDLIEQAHDQTWIFLEASDACLRLEGVGGMFLS